MFIKEKYTQEYYTEQERKEMRGSNDRVDISLAHDIQARAAASALVAPLSSMS